MRGLAIVLLVALALAACKSTPEKLREEGYENVREMDPLRPCPERDPDLDEAFVTERDGRSYEIKVCCHTYWTLMYCGKAMCPQPITTCSRYTEELRAEE